MKRQTIKKRPKWSSATVIAVFLLVFLSVHRTKSDKLCDKIVVDAITQLSNGSIVLFSGKDVWFVEQKENILVGPCPIPNIYKEMSGPVDAALTVSKHEMITDFVGSSIYFENQNFYTFKNLGQYEVEWGSLIYLPHKGYQTDMGMSDTDADKYMAQTISYAYFDPIDSKSKLVFSDGTVLSFTYDMGAEDDIPEITSIKDELNKYGVKSVPRTLTAGLTLTKDEVSELFLFNGSTFCSIKMSDKLKTQNCDLRPIKEFLNCDSMKRTNDFCLDYTGTESPEKPIVAEESVKSKSPMVEAKPEGKVQIRSDEQQSTIKTKEDKNRSDSLVQNIFVFAMTFVYMTFALI